MNKFFQNLNIDEHSPLRLRKRNVTRNVFSINSISKAKTTTTTDNSTSSTFSTSETSASIPINYTTKSIDASCIAQNDTISSTNNSISIINNNDNQSLDWNEIYEIEVE